MKKSALILIVLFFFSGCMSENKKTGSEQSQTKMTEMTELQKQVHGSEPDQSQKRIAKMTGLQKQIQDIDSELSRIIEYHRKEVNKLKSEREIIENKLKVLYTAEIEQQGQK